MSRIRDLEARRRELIDRCDAQRAALGARIAELNPFDMLRRGPGTAIGQLRHPLLWIAGFAGLLMLGRTREVLTFTLWVRSALSIAGRAARLVRLFTELRGSQAPAQAAAQGAAAAAERPATPRA